MKILIFMNSWQVGYYFLCFSTPETDCKLHINPKTKVKANKLNIAYLNCVCLTWKLVIMVLDASGRLLRASVSLQCASGSFLRASGSAPNLYS
jgi:hypothetical protein